MRLASLALAVATALALSLGTGAESRMSQASLVEPATPLYGITYTRSRGTLSRFDPATLAPVGRGLVLGQEGPLWAFSPDGSQVALASEDGLRIVDLRRMRVRGRMPGRRLVRGLVWPSPRRLLLAEHGEALLVDPVGPRVLRRARLVGTPSRVARTVTGLVVLGRDGQGIGPAELATIDGVGRVRTVTLARIPLGVDGGENNKGPFRTQDPALAVDDTGGRALVVGGDGTVAEVELATLAVRYREPQDARSALARLAAWLQPAARAKSVDGPTRSAAWIGGELAITGADLATRQGSTGSDLAVTSTPYGLRLLSLKSNELRLLDPETTALSVGAGLVLAHGSRYDGAPGTVRGSGLTAYRADGERVFHLFGDAPVETVFTHAGDAYVWAGGRLHAVELASGRVRTSVRPPGMVVFLAQGG